MIKDMIPELEEIGVKKEAYIAPLIVVMETQKLTQSHMGVGGDGNFSGENLS